MQRHLLRHMRTYDAFMDPTFCAVLDHFFFVVHGFNLSEMMFNLFHQLLTTQLFGVRILIVKLLNHLKIHHSLIKCLNSIIFFQ